MIEARLATFCGKDGQWRHEGVDGVPTRLEVFQISSCFTRPSYNPMYALTSYVATSRVWASLRLLACTSRLPFCAKFIQEGSQT